MEFLFDPAHAQSFLISHKNIAKSVINQKPGFIFSLLHCNTLSPGQGFLRDGSRDITTVIFSFVVMNDKWLIGADLILEMG